VKYINVALLILIVIIQGCDTNNSNDIAEAPMNYLNEALDILESNSINRKTINWNRFREDVLEKANNISTIDSTYPIIRYALNKLGDKHSRFIENYSEFMSKNKTKYPYARIINNNIAYINIPEFLGAPLVAENYAGRIYDYINAYSVKNVTGWIIDLRQNYGGNMWPMLAGLSPLLGEDPCGYFIDADNNFTKWHCKNGSSYHNEKKAASININPTELSLADSKVAVLIDSLTASSGEAIAVSFKGRKNCRLFGEPTLGLSSGNQTFKLSNGATLVLTVSIFADRNKNKYGNRVQPDEVLENPQIIDIKSNDNVIVAAAEWLNNN
jgi:C-terminal processing protease CtpA/Prc